MKHILNGKEFRKFAETLRKVKLLKANNIGLRHRITELETIGEERAGGSGSLKQAQAVAAIKKAYEEVYAEGQKMIIKTERLREQYNDLDAAARVVVQNVKPTTQTKRYLQNLKLAVSALEDSQR